MIRSLGDQVVRSLGRWVTGWQGDRVNVLYLSPLTSNLVGAEGLRRGLFGAGSHGTLILAVIRQHI